MGSTRLPGKSMMDLAGAPLVGRILERVKRAQSTDVVVLATTALPGDDTLAQLGHDYGVEVFRGSENDLVDRYLQAARLYGCEHVARLPADNFAPEPAEIDRIVEYHLSSGNAFSTNLQQILGNGYPDGLGCEVYSVAALAAVDAEVSDPACREHPHTNFFDFANDRALDPARFPVGTIECPDAFRRPDICLDVNTADDYAFAQALFEALYPRNPAFHITDVIDWYDTVWCGQSS